MKKNLKKSFVIILAVMLIFSLTVAPIAATEVDTYTYNGGYVGTGEKEHVALFKITKGSEEFKAYCADRENPIQNPTTYTAVELGGNTSDSAIRAMLFQSYPYINLSEFQQNTSEAGVKLTDPLTESQAITGIQYAIWHYTNNHNENDWGNPSELWGNAHEVYLYLIGLDGWDAEEPGSLKISDPTSAIKDNGDLEITFTYESPETAELTYSPEQSETWSVTDVDGTVAITIPASEVPANGAISFDITLNDNQSINEAYYFVNSEETSQKLVSMLTKAPLQSVTASFFREFRTVADTRHTNPPKTIVVADETPAAPAVIRVETPPAIVLDVPPIPAAPAVLAEPAALPRTGGLDALFLYGLGALLAGGGLLLRRWNGQTKL